MTNQTSPQPAAQEPATSTVVVCTRDGEVEIPSWETDVPGLVVVDINALPNRPSRQASLFSVVHALTGRKVGGVWSSLANAITAAVAVHTALHIDWTGHVPQNLANAVQMQFNQVHEDLVDWPVGRPTKLVTPLRHAGDNHAADAAVVCTVDGVQYLLLGEREDGAGWAIPGGRIEEDESSEGAALRELLEETGLDAAGVAGWQLTRSMPVDDHRNTEDRRVVTDLFLFDLGEVGELPQVTAGTDLVRVEWFPFVNLHDVLRAITGRGGIVFRPHPPLLDIVIAELRVHAAINAYFESNIRDSWRGVAPDEVEHQKRKYLQDVRVNPEATRQALAWFSRPGVRAGSAQH